MDGGGVGSHETDLEQLTTFMLIVSVAGEAVPVHGRVFGQSVGDVDADAIALGNAQRRTGHLFVVGKGLDRHSRTANRERREDIRS